LTQAQLAAVSNTGVRFIREIEKGKPSCQIAKAFYVAQILGIKIHLEDPNNVK
jgi:transcriptional regulator with XRE-family HTH domain